jgi:hypothetical protein
MSNSEQIFPAFIIVWVILGLWAGYFLLSNNAALKRKVWSRFVVVTGLLFVGFVVAMDFTNPMLIVVVPVVALISYRNLHAMRFCNPSATNMSLNPFVNPTVCYKCGGKLE